jgi:hypothetical protein
MARSRSESPTLPATTTTGFALVGTEPARPVLQMEASYGVDQATVFARCPQAAKRVQSTVIPGARHRWQPAALSLAAGARHNYSMALDLADSPFQATAEAAVHPHRLAGLEASAPRVR